MESLQAIPSSCSQNHHLKGRRLFGCAVARTFTSHRDIHYYDQGLYQRAEQFHLLEFQLRKTTLGGRHVGAMHELASARLQQGYYDKAKSALLQVLKLRKTVLGDKYPNTIRSMNNLTSISFAQGHYDKAEPLQAQVVELLKAVFGGKHPIRYSLFIILLGYGRLKVTIARRRRYSARPWSCGRLRCVKVIPTPDRQCKR